MRRHMEVEDEILSEIERRDTVIMVKNQMIEQKKQVIEQKTRVIEQQNKTLFATIRSLHERGISVREIAGLLSMKEEEVRPLLK